MGESGAARVGDEKYRLPRALTFSRSSYGADDDDSMPSGGAGEATDAGGGNGGGGGREAQS